MAWATGYTSDRTAVALAEARDLAVRNGGASERFASYYGQWTNHISRDEMRLAREVAEAFLADADSESDDEGRSVAESMLGVIHYFNGHFAMARDVLELATRRRHVRPDVERRFQFGVDIDIAATVYLGLVLWILGDFERSKATLEDAERRAVELGHKPTLANARHFSNIVLAYRGDSAALLPLVERQVQLCREHGMAFYLVLSEIYYGWAYANAVDPEAGLARIRAAIEEFKAMGVSAAMPFFCSLLAHAEMAAKHEEQAVFEIDAAIAIAPTAMIPRRTGYAAKSCSDAIRPIRRRRRKRSAPLATLLRNRAREALDCGRRCRLPSSAIRALTSPRPRPSSHPRLRA